MTHIVGGYPSMKECEEIANLMLKSGVHFLEIQIPFSDPIADGAVIMQANQDALKDGTTPEDCFHLMKRLKKQTKIPLLFMTYFNIAYHDGLEKFIKRSKDVGAYGLIIPDMPIDEEKEEHYLKLCRKHKLHAIQVISPITPERRLKKIAKVASGFVYCVARTGTTGSSKGLDANLSGYIQTVKKYIKIPLALGFGISSKAQVQAALKHVEIAVIGSKIIAMLKSKKRNAVKNFLKSLA